MNGPKILFYIPLFGGLPVTETLVNSWIVMAFLIVLSLWLTHGMKKQHISKKQVVVETGVKMLYQLVGDTMGEDKLYFTPYIGTLFLFTLCANLMGLFTFRSPTADLNTTAAFAIIFFGLVQVFSIKANGLKNRIKGFAEPVPVVLPLNIVGEFSTPVALALRLFGNMASGIVVTSLLYQALTWVSNLVFGSITSFPVFAVGIPAVLSIYFDLFTGCMQAFIISMLTMVFVAMAMD